MGKTTGFTGDSFKKIVDRAVHGYVFAGDTSIGMNLFHYFVDGIAFFSLLPLLFLSISAAFGFSLADFLSAFRADFRSG